MDKDIQNLQTKLQTTEEGMKQVEEWAASSKIFPVATKY